MFNRATANRGCPLGTVEISSPACVKFQLKEPFFKAIFSYYYCKQ